MSFSFPLLRDMPSANRAGSRVSSVKPIATIFPNRPPRHRANSLALTGRQRAAHRILPAAPFARAGLRVHFRLEAAVEPPGGGEAVEVRTDASLAPRQIRRPERGRFHEG